MTHPTLAAAFASKRIRVEVRDERTGRTYDETFGDREELLAWLDGCVRTVDGEVVYDAGAGTITVRER